MILIPNNLGAKARSQGYILRGWLGVIYSRTSAIILPPSPTWVKEAGVTGTWSEESGGAGSWSKEAAVSGSWTEEDGI